MYYKQNIIIIKRLSIKEENYLQPCVRHLFNILRIYRDLTLQQVINKPNISLQSGQRIDIDIGNLEKIKKERSGDD